MTRLDLTALPWKRRRILCHAVADATERWAREFEMMFKGNDLEEIAKLCACLRDITPRGRRRLETPVVRELNRLEARFQSKAARFEVARHAARIGVISWESSKEADAAVIGDIIRFHRAIDQTGRLNIWDVLSPWRACDAFEVLSLAEIPTEAREAFDAIWLAAEYTAAYRYAETWRALHVAA